MEDPQEQVPPDSTTSKASTAASEAPTTSSPPGISNVTPTSSTTNISRPSGLPKPSGIKPPSKIGRLCSNSTPKPAVPMSPRTDGGSTDTLRRLSSEYSRKQLSDLVEAEEDGEPSCLPSDSYRPHRKASTSSTYSVTSMDSLWEKHPRRLSEAGLRRSSDHSVVLTEDTDSFIIGERVWVGGTKPGQIAYIGETQFAPGEWAGIVLDEAIGKNDGSVAGVRYFQCSEKKGVFSRLTRLTRSPIIRHDASPVSDAGSVFERPPSGTPRRRTLSPNGSIKSAISSKMNASISTSTGPALQLGERVIVSSSRGSKLGALRFIGPTDFASGLWAGVELDDPIGKNDGSVEGKRYFECSPRFGLFAPMSKVSRSPSSRKPGACVIHNNGRATPLRRSNSRDSFTSLGTSIASSRVPRLASQRVSPRVTSTPLSAKNALQELLREKQQHIERLIKEREVERADVVKATLQAERAEAALAQLKKDAVLGTSENEKFKMEVEKLNKLLEDERQKVEDLMFRNEEENINKEDYNKYREQMEQEKLKMEQRIRDLEAEVSLQCSRAEASAASARALDQQRVADATTLAEQHKEELASAQTLSTELQKLLDEAYALLQEKENEKESLSKSMSDELLKFKMESEKALNETKSKMSIAQTEYETQVSVLTSKLQLTEAKLEAEKQNLERISKDSSQANIDLNAKLSQVQAALDDKTHELNKVLGTNKEHELNLNKEITKLKMELSAKLIDYEQMLDINKKQETTCKSLENEISRVNKEFASKINEYESLLNEITQQNDTAKTEVMLLQQKLTTKTKEYEKLIAESNVSNDDSQKIINEYKQAIHERDKEIIKLKDEYEQANASFNIKQSKIAEEYKKEIDNRNLKIEQLLKEIDGHKQLVESSKLEFDTLNTQFNVNSDENKVLKEQNEELKKSITELSETNSKLKNKISEMELEIGELKRQLSSSNERCSELQEMKEKIESEYLNLTGQTTDSNDQFNKLTEHLKVTEKELLDLKDKLREASNNYQRNEQELKQQNDKVQEEYSNEIRKLSHKLNESSVVNKIQKLKLGEYENQFVLLKNTLQETETSRDKSLEDNLRLNNDIESLKVKETELTKSYEESLKAMNNSVQTYKEEITILKAVGESSEVTLKEKVDQLIEAQNALNNKLEEAQKHEDALQKIVDDMTLQLNNQKINYEKEIVSTQTNLSAVKEEIQVVKSEEAKLKDLLVEKENNVKELLLKIGMYEVDVKSNAEIILEKERQISTINEELSKVVENKKSVEAKFTESFQELAELRQKYESMLSNSSAGESLLQGQQQQLEVLQKDLATHIHDKQVLQDSYQSACKELNNLKSDYSVIKNELQENNKMNSEFKTIIAEKEVQLKEYIDKYTMELNRAKGFEQELLQLSQELSTKNNIIKEKELELCRINELTDSNSSETQLQLKSLHEKNIELSSKHDSEVKLLNKTINDLQVQVNQQQITLEELSQSKNKITELQGLLEKSENDIKVLSNVNEGQKSNYDDLMKQLQSQYDDLKKDSKRLNSELKQKLSDSDKELRDAKTKMDAEITKQELLKKSLETSEANVVELSNQLELLSLQHNTNAENDGKLEKLTLELQAARKSCAEAVASNEAIVKQLNKEIQNKSKDLKDKELAIVKLKEDLKNQMHKSEISEREKCTLQKELASRPKDIVKDSNDNGLSTNTPQEEVEGQVSFLNSVIVDMQRKNEQLSARVRALEAGSTETPPETNGLRMPRAVAPRLFCDICDVFDAHDTEDCPRQCDAPEPPPQHRPKPPPRSYCDICEVFGHATEDCDEEETF